MNHTLTTVELGQSSTVGPETRVPTDRETRYGVDGLEARLSPFDSARVVNISLGGLAIETNKYLQIGKAYPIRFKRPSGLFRLTASVVWSQLTRTVAINEGEVLPVFLAGFQFSELSATQRGELEKLIGEESRQVPAGAGSPDAAANA